MTTRRAALVAITAIGLGACTPTWWLQREHSFSLDDIQRRLARRFPWKKSFLGLFELELVNPVAALDQAKGRVASSFDVTLRTKLSSRVFAGKAMLSGVPRYDDRERSFFFAEPTIDQLDFDGLPRAFADQLRELAAVLAPDVTQGLPLYTLRPEDTRVMGTAMTAKSIRVERDRLVVELVPLTKP